MIQMKCHTWLNADELKSMLKKASKDPLMKCAGLIMRQAKQSMKQGGKLHRVKYSGRVRTRSDAYFNIALNQWVVPSKPGMAPHAQTKKLRESITIEIDGGAVRIGPTTMAWYGRLHEFGGKNHPPRPFMRPALYAVMKRFPEYFRDLKINGGEMSVPDEGDIAGGVAQ